MSTISDSDEAVEWSTSWSPHIFGGIFKMLPGDDDVYGTISDVEIFLLCMTIIYSLMV
jgi:hypothetical protein